MNLSCKPLDFISSESIISKSGQDTGRIDRMKALSRFGGWWCMAVLSWWSDLSG